MIIIHSNATGGNSGAKVIRPCPLISIAFAMNRNKMGSMGGSYTITLTGAILPDEGSPYAGSAGGVVSDASASQQNFATAYDPRPTGQSVPVSGRMGAILHKQNALRELFAIDGQKMEILPITGNEAAITCFPTLESINFEEGVYINICRYTITLKAEVLYDKALKVLLDGSVAMNFEPSGNMASMVDSAGGSLAFPIGKSYGPHTYATGTGFQGRETLENMMLRVGGFVEDFSENWAIELDDSMHNTNMVDPSTSPRPVNILRGYRLTRNMSATGKTMFSDSGRYEAWQQAKGFILKKLYDPSGSMYDYPKLTLDHLLASGFLNLADQTFGGYNHSRTESIDKTAGTYSTSDTWLLSSGTAYESYSTSFSSSAEVNQSTATIDGTIKGLTSISASGNIYGGNEHNASNANNAYDNAVLKYQSVSNSGNFGVGCHIYKRLQNVSNLSFLPQPISVTVGTNELTGEITYNIVFSNRPGHILDDTVSENITINDTYPGDVFAIIPVLGRANGPVLQYLGSRTEYKRDVTISMVFNFNTSRLLTTTVAPYGSTTSTLSPTGQIAYNRDQFVFSKPTLFEPNRSLIFNLMKSLSPAYEIGVRKYFLSPPVETWNPYDRSYSISLSWTYELDH